ncbi:putative cytochrome b-c1 complex subunit 8 [Helianthus annuus]|nr:putative cytochrome b-c1 complex subunit 8 [Helianthus annuus]
MGKIPVKIKSVVYGLSPFQQKIMPGLWNEFTHKITHKVTENWLNAVLLVGPVVGVYSYVFDINIPVFCLYVESVMCLILMWTEKGKKMYISEHKKNIY